MSLISNVGTVELDNDCAYSLESRTVRSRESAIPKEDLAFYFNEYLEPKYGLGNINVNNVASFMKDLEMNWSKLTPDLKDKVMNILVDNILTDNYDFKTALLGKLGIPINQQVSTFNDVPVEPAKFEDSTIRNVSSKSNFGVSTDNSLNIFIMISIILAFTFMIVLLNKKQ